MNIEAGYQRMFLFDFPVVEIPRGRSGASVRKPILQLKDSFSSNASLRNSRPVSWSHYLTTEMVWAQYAGMEASGDWKSIARFYL